MTISSVPKAERRYDCVKKRLGVGVLLCFSVIVDDTFSEIQRRITSCRRRQTILPPAQAIAKAINGNGNGAMIRSETNKWRGSIADADKGGEWKMRVGYLTFMIMRKLFLSHFPTRGSIRWSIHMARQYVYICYFHATHHRPPTKHYTTHLLLIYYFIS